MYTDVKQYKVILLLSLTVPVVKADRDVVGWVRVFLAVSKKEGHKLIILFFFFAPNCLNNFGAKVQSVSPFMKRTQKKEKTKQNKHIINIFIIS